MAKEKARKSSTAGSASASKPRDKVEKVVRKAKDIATSPAASEVVAATLVAAAAALRDPKKARALAAEAADDLKQAAKSGVEGGALWQLALDVARRSIDAIGNEKGGKSKDKAKKILGKVKDKAKDKSKDKARKAGKQK